MQWEEVIEPARVITQGERINSMRKFPNSNHSTTDRMGENPIDEATPGDESLKAKMGRIETSKVT